MIGSAAANTWSSNKDREQAQKLADQKATRVREAMSSANATYDDILKQLQAYRNNQYTFSSPEMVKDYKDTLSSFKPENYVYDFDKFNYDKTAQDYITPYMDQIIAATGNKVQNTAAGAGLGRSGGTAYDIAEAVAEKNDELYRTALQDYRDDRNFAYQEYSDFINNMQNKYNTMANLTGQKLSAMSGAIQHDEAQDKDYMSDILAIMQDKASNKINASLYA